MPEKLSLALAQLNPMVGDISGNLAKLRAARKKAAEAGAHLLMTSELYICGYPPEDLVLKPSFQTAVHKAVETLARETNDGGPAILLGTPWLEEGKLYNAMLLLNEGRIAGKTYTRELPNYGPFDEKRVFTSWQMPEPIGFRGLRLGVMICEDMWTPTVGRILKSRGAQIFLVPNGSPFEISKMDDRRLFAEARIKENGLPLVYVHQVGGQDELVFDGSSFVLDREGKCAVQAAAWDEDFIVTHWTVSQDICQPEAGVMKPVPQGESAIYWALMTGLRDYVTKNGFPGVVLGLSGGIDSALTAAIAVDALGPDKVWAVMMPSPYTSEESLEDAAEVAKALRCKYDVLPITTAMAAFSQSLTKVFTGRIADTTEENVQSRCRGMMLMALSNKFGPMVISTGNKSEMSVGYTTLYGDLCGGFAVLKDVYKTKVFKLAQWRNTHNLSLSLGPAGMVIPERVITKPPSAELKPDQADQDTLPPYDMLDAILECLIEKDMGMQEIAGRHDAATVKRVWSMLDKAEYKRRQAPPGVKITRRSFGKDRRYPITNKYRET
jgi:NAD+ synthase